MNNVKNSSFRCDFDLCHYWQNPEGTKEQKKKAARNKRTFNPDGECQAGRGRWQKCPYRKFQKETHEYLGVQAELLGFMDVLDEWEGKLAVK